MIYDIWSGLISVLHFTVADIQYVQYGMTPFRKV